MWCYEAVGGLELKPVEGRVIPIYKSARKGVGPSKAASLCVAWESAVVKNSLYQTCFDK